MSRNNRKMNLRSRAGPSRAVADDDGSTSRSSSPTSPPSSCVSSESEQGQKKSDSPESSSSMVLAGCPRCLMYVMLCEKDPKCPKCNSALLLDFNLTKKT